VVDDELEPPLEEVEQAGLAVAALEDVLRADLDHGQPALSASRARVAAFSLTSNSSRAARH